MDVNFRVSLESSGFQESLVQSILEDLSADTLNTYMDSVHELGEDPREIIKKSGIDLQPLRQGNYDISYVCLAQLLEFTAEELACPDFGMRMARHPKQRNYFGPVAVGMRNARTWGEALNFIVDYVRAHSSTVAVRLEHDAESCTTFYGSEVLIDGVLASRQALEYDSLICSLNLLALTGGKARPRAILFRHQPLSPPKVYRQYFGCEVRFNQFANGLVFSNRDFSVPIVRPDHEQFEIAAATIETNSRDFVPSMQARLRALLILNVGDEDFTSIAAAERLNLHPRTMQRRLKAEGTTFEKIRDEVRRDIAMLYLRQHDLAVSRVAEHLGFAETSVLSRSCRRWFGASAREMRSAMQLSR